MRQVDLSNPRQKLKLFASPVAHAQHAQHVDGDHSNGSSLKDRSERTLTGLTVTSDEGDEGIPLLKRHEEPTLLEIFFDLFFAANYEVFGDTQRVTSHSKFKAYIGYFSLLWLTWFMVTLYDVRFTTDSMFARFTKGIHFGVLVGFAVVTPKFNPTEQDSSIMTTMSLILMISRLCLAVEYLGTFFQLRKYPRTRIPIILQIVLHAVSAMVFLGISFAFHDDIRTRAYMTWYFIAGAEAIVSLILSFKCPVLSLTKTHLMKRMTLLTIMFMGDGLVQIAKEVVIIVQHRNAWDPPTIGSITAAVAGVYFVFLVYFDWLRSNYYLSKVRQIIWTAVHLPFHLSLVLFMQSFTQYLIWAKVVVQFNRAFNVANPLDAEEGIEINSTTTTADIVQSLNTSIQAFFRDWPPKIASTEDSVKDSLKRVSEIPDDFWWAASKLPSDTVDGDSGTIPDKLADSIFTVYQEIVVLASAMSNALFGAFGIDVSQDVLKNKKLNATDIQSGNFQVAVESKTWDRYSLEFVSGYIASGCTLLFMAILTVIVRNTQWKRWPVVRLIIIILLAICTACTATLWFANGDDDDTNDLLSNFLNSLWVMPTLTLVWTIVIILTHINGDMVKEPLLYSWQKFKQHKPKFVSRKK